jgi:hypothetical protein
MIISVQRISFVALLSFLAAPLAAQTPPPPDSGARGALDGAVFDSVLTVDQYDAPFIDRMTFARGMFYSEECQHACDFGWADYHSRSEGDATAFVIEMTCSDAPQSVRWEGRVIGDRIEGDVVWTVERFYWSVRRTGRFEGRLVATDDRQAAIAGE